MLLLVSLRSRVRTVCDPTNYLTGKLRLHQGTTFDNSSKTTLQTTDVNSKSESSAGHKETSNSEILSNNVIVLQFIDHVNSVSKSVPTSIDATKLLTEDQLQPQAVQSLINCKTVLSLHLRNPRQSCKNFDSTVLT